VNITQLNLTIFAAFWTFIVALASWFAGDKFAIRREARFKRERFCSFIKQLRTYVESIHLREFAFVNHLVFDATIKRLPELEREVIEVEQHIRQRDRQKFMAAWTGYKAIGQQLGDEQKNAPAKAQLLSCLDDLLRCAR
jgi:hypothetical protein